VNADEFISKMNSLKATLENELPDIMGEAGTSAVSLISERFNNSGQDANGALFGKYSETTIRIKQKKSKQTAFVTLRDTNRMWSNIGIINVKTGNNIAIVKMGGRLEFTRKKLRDNQERFGKRILDVNNSEKAQLSKIIEFRVQQIINRTF